MHLALQLVCFRSAYFGMPSAFLKTHTAHPHNRAGSPLWGGTDTWQDKFCTIAVFDDPPTVFFTTTSLYSTTTCVVGALRLLTCCASDMDDSTSRIVRGRLTFSTLYLVTSDQLSSLPPQKHRTRYLPGSCAVHCTWMWPGTVVLLTSHVSCPMQPAHQYQHC